MSWDPGRRPNLATTAHMTSEQMVPFKSKHTKTKKASCLYVCHLFLLHFFLDNFFTLNYSYLWLISTKKIIN